VKSFIILKQEAAMNRIVFSIVLVALGVAGGQFVSSGVAEQATTVRGAGSEKLIALRTERRDALRRAAKLAEEGYRAGLSDIVLIPRIAINLVNAELDLAPDRAARVAVRERAVEQFKVIEELVTSRVVEAKIANTSDLLEAKAARIQAEIDLLLETADGK
jgi:hypothetical protein